MDNNTSVNAVQRAAAPEDGGASVTRFAASALFQMLHSIAAVSPRAFLGALAAFGSAAGRCRRQERDIACAQLAFAYQRNPDLTQASSPELRKKLTLKVFAHAARFAGEALLIDWLLGKTRSSSIRVSAEGDEVLYEIIREGNGGLALSGHIGCFELLAAYHVLKGQAVDVVGRTPNYPLLAEMLCRVRAGYGANAIWRDERGSLKSLLKALRQGHFVAALIDQDAHLENGFSPFFGEQAASPITLVKVAVDYRMPIFTTFIVRTEPTHHHVISERIIYDAAAPDAVQSILDTYNRRLEQLICRYPDQWFWWHRRWRRRPGVDYSVGAEKPPTTAQYINWLNQRISGCRT